jgi:hypothetical protein
MDTPVVAVQIESAATATAAAAAAAANNNSTNDRDGSDKQLRAGKKEEPETSAQGKERTRQQDFSDDGSSAIESPAAITLATTCRDCRARTIYFAGKRVRRVIAHQQQYIHTISQHQQQQ